MEDKQRANEQKKRLEQLVIHLRMNTVDLANLAGLNKNTLYHVGSGDRSEMTERTAARICYHLEKKKGIVVNRKWLLDGEGEMIMSEPLLHNPLYYDVSDDAHLGMVAEAGEKVDATDWKAKYLNLLEKYTRLLESLKS